MDQYLFISVVRFPDNRKTFLENTLSGLYNSHDDGVNTNCDCRRWGLESLWVLSLDVLNAACVGILSASVGLTAWVCLWTFCFQSNPGEFLPVVKASLTMYVL